MVAQEFVRSKIRNVVDDPVTAELLCPNYTIFSKRPPLGHHYYETFNRPNVQLVDIAKTPIETFTQGGLKTADNEYQFDIIILAIGFDAVTGTLGLIDVRNSDGIELSQHLETKWETAYGITVNGFPNLFMPYGPLAPFGNFPVPVDNTCLWVGRMISHMKEKGYSKVESTSEFGKFWQESSEVIFNSTLMAAGARETRSW
jgi:cyclohexanone monooxygenase